MYNDDRQATYKQHRLRVLKATSLVNSQAPKPKPTREELRKFNYLEMMEELVRNNKPLSNVKTSSEMQEIKRHFQHEKEKSAKDNETDFPIPFHIRQRYDHLDFIKDWNVMQKLLRPNIFLELMNNRCQPLGRLVIQLYTEACPEVVQQFVRACLAKKNDHFQVTRLLFPLWLEAELKLNDQKALRSSNIEHDPMAINHGCSAGILSFPSRYLRGSKLPFITFTLSFTPIDVLNGKRIAFGIIKYGQKTLERLQSLEVTRFGKPCKSIAVSACGVCN